MDLVKKLYIFHLFFLLGILCQENVFHDIQKALLNYKNRELNKSKNWDFFKGISQWFWSKNGKFSIFFFLPK